ncbi:hypothetical protein AVEN_166211-1 [Araneus ventricosus]|uniref:Uncharacterized protein n=1 Tax=Araneus ventricosus TaxID=182803 RepID=A0A4Y2UHT0_ARAVE|nr:hypothetical protein AVEN_166211-1 [Araneus ventricosus]
MYHVHPAFSCATGIRYQGHGRAFCQYKSLSHAHPTGSVAVMASGTRKNAAAFCQYNSLSMSILPVQLLSWHQASGKERRSVSITHCPMSILPVQLLSWHQTRGHGAAFCQYNSLSHVHPTGSVAVMPSDTGTWRAVLSV